MKREKISGGIHTVQQLLADGHVLRLYVADNKKSKNLTALVGEAQARGVPVETVAREITGGSPRAPASLSSQR